MKQNRVRCWIYKMFPAEMDIDTGEVHCEGWSWTILSPFFTFTQFVMGIMFDITGGEPVFTVWLSPMSRQKMGKGKFKELADKQFDHEDN